MIIRKLVYSFGLTRGCGHYIDDVEHFMDVKTLDEFYTQPNSSKTIVIAGKLTGGGDYNQSEISVYELHNRYIELSKIYSDEDVVVTKLLEEYKCEPLRTNNKYHNRYYSTLY